MSSTIYFGKHNENTLVEIVWTDPSWFYWAMRNNIFAQRGGQRLQIEAEAIWDNARNIRIPRGYPQGGQAAYYYQPKTGKLVDVMIVDTGAYEEDAHVSGVLDLGHVCEIGRDGRGNKILVRAIKRILFGNKTRVTIEMLEQFFANPDNFDLPQPAQQAAE